MRRRTLLLAPAIVAACAVLSPLTAVAQQKPPIKIGAILPVTGFVATAAVFFRTSMELALEDVNKAGGVNGSRLELTVEDDRLDPAQSVLLFRKLASAGYAAVIGPVSSSSWETVAPLAERMSMPTVNFTTFKEEIANNPWTVRIHPHEGIMIPEAMKTFARLHPNVKRVVVAGDVKEASSEAAMRQFAKAAKDNGMEVVETIEFQTQTTDFAPMVTRVRGARPDAILSAGLTQTILAFLRELRTQQVSVPLVNNAMIWIGGFPAIAGPAGANVYTVGFSTNEDIAGNDRHNQFIRRFKERLRDNTSIPQPPNAANAVLGYEGIALLAQVMKAKGIDGTTDVKKAREMIKQGLSELKTVDGIYKINIDKDRNGYLPGHLLKLNVAAKEWVYVAPPGGR